MCCENSEDRQMDSARTKDVCIPDAPEGKKLIVQSAILYGSAEGLQREGAPEPNQPHLPALL